MSSDTPIDSSSVARHSASTRRPSTAFKMPR